MLCGGSAAFKGVSVNVWEPIAGLTSRAQAVYRQNWDMLTWMGDNIGQPDFNDVLDAAIGLENNLRQITDDKKYVRQPGRTERKMRDN